MGDMLSQAEIDDIEKAHQPMHQMAMTALIRGSVDALGEIGNISMGKPRLQHCLHCWDKR